MVQSEKVGEQLSPAQSQFSFQSSPRSVQDVDKDDSRHLHPGAVQQRPRSSRSRQQFYEDSFAYKDGIASSARERVTKDAPVVAELRTNVIIKDEYTLVTDLSHHLSTRYQRPESSIMITVNHSACLLLGGSFEPTYIITINALPTQLQPTTNKRNAALIQTFMAESIGVTPERGIVKFVPIAEEAFATNGMTMLGEIERLERQQVDENGGNLKRAMTKGSRKSTVSKAKSSMALGRKESKANAAQRDNVTPPLPHDGPLDSAVAVNEKGVKDGQPLKPVDSKMNAKKSEPLMAKFSKRASGSHIAPPPIPDDKPMTPAVTKRKSFLSVFKR